MFGATWRKSTVFAAVNLDLHRLNYFRCLGSRREGCKRTGRPHVPLAGQALDGRWMTQIAEPYPVGLCRLLAQEFANHDMRITIEAISRHTMPESLL